MPRPPTGNARDARKLEKTRTPGVYRRHKDGCPRGRCGCPCVVVWRDRGRQHKRVFAKESDAREFKNDMGGSKGSRRPLAKATVAEYHAAWFPTYRGTHGRRS